MMKYEISKDQILQLHHNTKHENDQLVIADLKNWFPDAFKPVLEVGKWYKNNEGAIVNFQGESRGFGFCNSCKWTDKIGGWSFGNNPEKWQEATKEEVFEMLKKEAEKRGFKEWVFIKRDFENLKYTFINPNTFPEDDNFYFSIDEDYLEMFGFVIYSKGKWAEIIPTMTKLEAEAKLNCKIV